MSTYGSNLITNGTFDTTLNGWTYSAGWSVVAGRAKATSLPVSNVWMSQTLTPLSANSEYEISFVTEANTVNNRLHIYLGSIVATVKSILTQTGALTEHTYVVKPNGTNNSFRFEWGNLSTNSVIYVDNIVVREIIPPITRLTKSRGFYGSNHGFYR